MLDYALMLMDNVGLPNCM